MCSSIFIGTASGNVKRRYIDLEHLKLFSSSFCYCKLAILRPAASEMEEHCLHRRPCLASFRYALSGTSNLKMLYRTQTFLISQNTILGVWGKKFSKGWMSFTLGRWSLSYLTPGQPTSQYSCPPILYQGYSRQPFGLRG